MESTIGRYRLLKRLASGGMGEVYLAAQTGAQGFQKFVALKRVAASAAADPEIISLFLDEARLVATLSHRAIVQVYDLGQDEQGFFVAMEFVQGPSIRALLDRLAAQQQPLAPGLALDIAAQVGDALASAYYSRAPDGTPLRIIHRDVSPRNILVSVTGDVKLIDFGIAQSMRQVGNSGSLTGKLAYMSPEQLRSEPLNARSDLFSLGIVLCEMLGGENPFARSDPKDMILAIQREDPVLPSKRNPSLAPCDGVLRRLLAKLPSERFADGIELAEALAEVRAHFPKPPKRLGAVVSDLFGLEINELLREVSQGMAKAEVPAARPAPVVAAPVPVPEAAPSTPKADAVQAHTPSIYHRATQPYLSISKELVEVTQPDLALPKIVRAELLGNGLSEPLPPEEPEKTRPEPIPESLEAVVPEAPVVPAVATAAAPGEVPVQPLAIDLPELKELAKPTSEVPAPEPAPGAPSEPPGPGSKDFDESSWYKHSIPPGRAPGWVGAANATPAQAQAQVEPVETPAAPAAVPPEATPAAPVAPEALSPPVEAAVRPPAPVIPIRPALGAADVSAETTMPGVKPARRRSHARSFGLPALAGIAVLIGIAIGLYLVREPAPQPQRAAPTPGPAVLPVAVPTPPTPATGVAGAAADPAPTPSPDPGLATVLEPLAPLDPIPARLETRVEKPRTEAKPKEPEKVASDAVHAEPAPPQAPEPTPTPAPEKKAEPSFQLSVEGPGGAQGKTLSGNGTVQLAEAEGMVVAMNYQASSDGLKASLECQPWAIAAVGGLSVGRTPIPLELKDQPLKVELRRPGATPVTLVLGARKSR